MASFPERLRLVQDQIGSAAARAGRRADDVTLVAVSKVFPVEVIEEAYALGLRDFGENYVQEFEGKFPRAHVLADAKFHLIGHLQSNKSRKAAELFNAVHTVDTPKLAQRLGETGKELDVFIEVKLSDEEAKAGCEPEAIPAIVDAVRACPTLRLQGLMTLPPWSDDAEPSRPYFRRLRELGEQHGLSKFSMGMSHDFEVAIQEGATHVRIGTALFGKRIKK